MTDLPSTFTARLYGASHRLPDRELGADLVSMLTVESDATPWWAIVLRSDGRLHVATSQPDLEAPAPEKREFARRLVLELNRVAAYTGAWVVWWCDGGKRLAYLWKDSDGDLQIVCDTDDLWPRVRAVGVDKWVEDGDAALRKWVLAHTKLLERRPEQTFKRALGQPEPPRTSL